MPHVKTALPTAIVMAGLAVLSAGCSQTEGGAKVAVSAAPSPTTAAPAATETAAAQGNLQQGTAGAPVMAAIPVPQPAPREIAHAQTGLDGLIERYAAYYEVPTRLVRRVVDRESKGNPRVYHKGNWGLMQIKYPTARSLGFDGPADALLDAETNLKYAVKYLRGAYMVADGDEDRAVRYYAAGYYYDAKRKGLLEETGLRPGDPGADPKPAPSVMMASLEQPVAAAAGFVPRDTPVAAAGAGVVNPVGQVQGGAETSVATFAAPQGSPKAARLLAAVSTSSRMQAGAPDSNARAGSFGQAPSQAGSQMTGHAMAPNIGQAFVSGDGTASTLMPSSADGAGALMAYAAFTPSGPVPVPTPAPARP